MNAITQEREVKSVFKPVPGTRYNALKALQKALYMRGLTLPENAVLLALLLHRNAETGQCNPSHTTLAKELGTSTRSIERAIHGLKHKQLVLAYQEDRTKSNLYDFGLAFDEFLEESA